MVRPRSVRGGRRQARVFDTALAGHIRPTRRFFAHVLHFTLRHVKRRENPFTPVSAEYVRAKFPGADWKPLQDEGLLNVLPYDREEGLSREYAVSLDFVDDFLEAGAQEGWGTETPFRDLATSKPTRTITRRTTHDAQGNAAPELIRKVIRLDWRSVLNPEAVLAHLQRSREAIQNAVDDGERGHLKARLRVDLACWNAVLAQRPEPWGDAGLLVYTPPYAPASSGRIYETIGGLQMCTREMKAAAREGVPGVRNYDLASAQPRLAVHHMREAHLPTSALAGFTADPTARARLAAEIGMSEGALKTALLGVLMGGRVPTPAQVPYSDGRVVNAVRRDAGDRFGSVYPLFVEATEPIRREVSAWHDHLVDVWIPESSRRTPSGAYVRNASGASRAVASLSPTGNRHEVRSGVAAFVLQGLEAAIVHRIALSHEAHGFGLVAHEYDGLVTLGEVPREAVAAAARATGVPEWATEFKEKPFT